jgi:hypothetical protein
LEITPANIGYRYSYTPYGGSWGENNYKIGDIETCNKEIFEIGEYLSQKFMVWIVYIDIDGKGRNSSKAFHLRDYEYLSSFYSPMVLFVFTNKSVQSVLDMCEEGELSFEDSDEESSEDCSNDEDNFLEVSNDSLAVMMLSKNRDMFNGQFFLSCKADSEFKINFTLNQFESIMKILNPVQMKQLEQCLDGDVARRNLQTLFNMSK